jgi:D-beta-D-heptose 7-phosphate kinase/D-beta-D-heptose 1-phosphate adenosyltransferase
VPVVWRNGNLFMPGRFNVASNLAALVPGHLYGVVGEDKNGDILLDLLRQKGVDCDGVMADTTRRTTVKTRIIAAHQQMVRLDWENTEHLLQDRLRRLIGMMEEKIPHVDALIIEDYGKGLIGPYLLKRIVALARKNKKIVTVDPKIEHFNYYKGVTALTPNEKEASAGAGISIKTEGDIDRIGWKLAQNFGGGVLVTLGNWDEAFFGARAMHSRAYSDVAQEAFDFQVPAIRSFPSLHWRCRAACEGRGGQDRQSRRRVSLARSLPLSPKRRSSSVQRLRGRLS